MPEGELDPVLPLEAPHLDRVELSDPVLISDLHLAVPGESTAQAFTRFCAGPARDYRELLVLGDLFEYWAGDDDLESDIGRLVADALAAVAAAGTRVFLMQGNRDLLLGRRYANACGAQLLVDPVRAQLRGSAAGEPPLLLAHGDRYCTLDLDYQRFRAQVRDRRWQQQFLAQPLAARHAVIGAARARSEVGKREKSMEIMDVTPAAVAQELMAAGATTMIHGHTHRPGHYPLDGGDRPLSRWVLPDWDLDATPPRGGFLDLRGDPWQLQPLAS